MPPARAAAPSPSERDGASLACLSAFPVLGTSEKFTSPSSGSVAERQRDAARLGLSVARTYYYRKIYKSKMPPARAAAPSPSERDGASLACLSAFPVLGTSEKFTSPSSGSVAERQRDAARLGLSVARTYYYRKIYKSKMPPARAAAPFLTFNSTSCSPLTESVPVAPL